MAHHQFQAQKHRTHKQQNKACGAWFHPTLPSPWHNRHKTGTAQEARAWSWAHLVEKFSGLPNWTSLPVIVSIDSEEFHITELAFFEPKHYIIVGALLC
jgi:hypothetical protein